jgi:lipopolysaccharide export system protein LptA
MKRSEAARYARWSALAALVLATITGGIYLQRKWVAHVERKKAPPPLTEDKERQSIGLTVSKNEGDRTIFTVQASKSTDFKGQDISLLEDVKITVFGKAGDRHDLIHTQSCRYSKVDGAIECSGNVQMDLQSAADAERTRSKSGTSNVIHVETSGVTFERTTGQAQTVKPVKFSFADGEGEGLGAVYSSEEGELRLVKDVRITLHATAPPGTVRKGLSSTKEVTLHGSSMQLEKLSRKAVLYGPATAETTDQQLNAGQLTMLMDEEYRARRLVAAPGKEGETPRVVSRAGKERETLSANLMTAELMPEGWVSSIEAEGDVKGSSPNGELHADNGLLEMWPRVNEAKAITLNGNVRVDGRDPKTGEERKLTTNVLQLSFSEGGPEKRGRIQHAATPQRGTTEWSDASGVRSKLSADKLDVEFGETGKAQHLLATGNVETERQLKGGVTQTAMASTGDVQLDAQGGWTQMTLHDNVRMKEGTRSAEAQQAAFFRAQRTAVLTGQAVARDENSETHAEKLTFHQDSGDLEAEGKVLSTDLAAKKSGIQLSAAAANISADHMVGNSKTGRALYTGHRARLWQEPSVLEADSIELLRGTRVLNAKGEVHGEFPQSSTNGAPKGKPLVWHVSSETLTYSEAENRAHLEKNVVAQSNDERMRGPVLDLYFTKQGNGGARTSQISRAVATGGVVVEQGAKKGTAERGVYTAEDQKFVLSGGTPTLYDAEEGTTTGRELTFNIANDTIVVDSGNGTRTLTRHRVQR